MVKLTVYKNGTVSDVRCEVEKWEFQDKAMGEQFVMFTIDSPVPIPFAVGDWCEFRGQRYTLNVEPTCTQKAGIGTYGAAFTYESVKFNSPQDDLTRCIMLDVVPTSGEHKAAYGTNYTGSANFTLNCFETTFVYQGQTITYAPVHALLDRIKANLDRFVGDPSNGWNIYLDDSKCHSDDYIITFNNWTAAQALAEVHNTFKLDYTVRGRNILVGDVSDLDLPSELEGVNGYVTDLTAQDQPIFFGYGKGYLQSNNQGKSLFQIKKLSKNDQQIVTRLRAVGSTKNMPYRYYHNTYGTAVEEGDPGLPQTMFVQNLQLPDTFLPPTAGEGEDSKATGNATRDDVYGEGVLRHVLGETNDAYIDKNDDAASCPEGVREAVARWDGSDSELPEIYPTIEGANYRELRANNVADMAGRTGNNAFPIYLPYGGNDSDERIDEIFDVGNDCNIGDGVMTESEALGQTKVTAPVQKTSRSVTFANTTQTFSLFTIDDAQEPGDYILSYTTQEPQAFVTIDPGTNAGQSFRVTASVTIRVRIEQVPVDGSSSGEVTRYVTTGQISYGNGSYASTSTGAEYYLVLPDFHNTETEWQTSTLTLTKKSTVRAYLDVVVTNTSTTGDDRVVDFSYFRYLIGVRGSNNTSNVNPQAIWQPSASTLYYSDQPFHLMLKDIGVDFSTLSSVDGGDITLSMKSGQCAGREFTVKPGGITKHEYTGSSKGYWELELDRVNDDSIHAYFPSSNNRILAGDQYVLLNIALPDAYIKAAETRLLVAATNHLADNCETKYTYQPSVDDIYLQRNLDFHANDPENSVFWRLYAGMKFPFYGIPKEATDPLPVADITIESVSIKMGEKPTPQVEITLNDKLDQSSIQRLQVTVDRLYGSVFSHGGAYGTSTAISDAIIRDFGKAYFLSKINDDEAAGKITFNGGVSVPSLAELSQVYVSDTIGTSSFMEGYTGYGWQINSDGNLTLNNLTVRETMRVFELLIQKVRATGGEIIVSPANGKVKSVESVAGTLGSGYYSVVIENGDEGSYSFGNMFKVSDWVRCQRWDRSLQTMRSYWARVTHSEGDTIRLPWEYFGVGSNRIAPQVGDELVLMGNSLNANRQGAISISATDNGKPRITILNGITHNSLDGCTRAVLGDLNGITDSAFTGDNAISGYGLYSDNVYLKGDFRLKNGNTEVNIGQGLIDLQAGLGSVESSLDDVEAGLGYAGIALDGANSKITLTAEKTIVSDDLVVKRLITNPDTSSNANNQARVEVYGSVMDVFGSAGKRNIHFGVDPVTGLATMSYYDNNGHLLYDLGPSGLQYIRSTEASFESTTFYTDIETDDNINSVTRYRFTAKRVQGIITADSVYADTAQVATEADGLWFTTSPIHNNQGELINLANDSTLVRFASDKKYNLKDSLVEASSANEYEEWVKSEFGFTDIDPLISFAGDEIDGFWVLRFDTYVQRVRYFTDGIMNEKYIIWQPRNL